MAFMYTFLDLGRTFPLLAGETEEWDGRRLPRCVGPLRGDGKVQQSIEIGRGVRRCRRGEYYAGQFHVSQFLICFARPCFHTHDKNVGQLATRIN